MKKLLLTTIMGFALVACSKEELDDTPGIVSRFADYYEGNGTVASVADFNIEGLTTNNAFPELNAWARITATVAPDNIRHAIITLTLNGQLFGKIDNTDLKFELRAVDFKEVIKETGSDEKVATYQVESAKFSSSKFAEGAQLNMTGLQPHRAKGADMNWEGYITLPVNDVVKQLDEADAKNLRKAVQTNGNESVIRIKLKVNTSNTMCTCKPLTTL